MRNAIIPLVLGLFIGGALTMGIREYLVPNQDMMTPTDSSESMESGMDMSMSQMSTKIEELRDTEFDIEFARLMIDHHQGAIDMARLSMTNTSNPEILDLAVEIIDAQEQEIELMNSWLLRWSEDNAVDN